MSERDALRRQDADATPEGLDAAAAARLLAGVFEEAGVQANSVPFEALASYSPLRPHRLRWRLLLGCLALACCLLGAALAAVPRFDVTACGLGGDGLPVYEVRVRGLLPVRRVRAALDGEPLGVAQEDLRLFALSPWANGTLAVQVSLANNRSATQEVTVTDVDDQAPALTSSEVVGDEVRLYVTDAGAGVDYKGIYALTPAYELCRPVSTDEATGLVSFAYPTGRLDVYVPDLVGNTLHLAMELG